MLRFFFIAILLGFLSSCTHSVPHEGTTKAPSFLTGLWLQEETRTPRAFVLFVDAQQLERTIDLLDLLLEGIGQRNQRVFLVASEETFYTSVQRELEKRRTPSRQKLQFIHGPHLTSETGHEWKVFEKDSGSIKIVNVGGSLSEDQRLSMENLRKELSRFLSTRKEPVDVTLTALPFDFARLETGRVGRSAGNFESWPFEIGVISSSDFSSEAEFKEYFPYVFNREMRVHGMDTTWARGGKISDFIKILQTRETKSGCILDALYASPRKAIKVLEQKREEKFFTDLGIKGDAFEKVKSQRTLICEKLGLVRPSCFEDLKNEEVLLALQAGLEFQKVNAWVDQKVQEFREPVEARLRGQCAVNWISVPMIYSGSLMEGQIQSFSGEPLVSPPLNSILVGQSLIAMDYPIRSFQDDLRVELRKVRHRIEFLPPQSDFWHNDPISSRGLQSRLLVLREPGVKTRLKK
jgi:hypothetical protein